MQRDQIWAYCPALPRPGQALLRLILSADGVNQDPALPVVIGAQIIDRDPEGLLSVRLEAHGWLSLLAIEPVLRSRLDEVDGVSPGPGMIVVCYSHWATRREIRTIEQGLPLTWIDHPTNQQETSLSPDLAPHRHQLRHKHGLISGIRQHLPNATMTFDRYHLAAKLSEAVDTVRRHEVTTRPELKHTRWLWLKNRRNLTTAQRRELHRLMRPSTKLATARALRWREDFQAFYDQDSSYADEYLRCWCSGAKRSRLQPVKDFVALVEKHWQGILAWHKSHLNNGLLEGINSLVQAVKARARDYRSKTKMITIVYPTASKLQLPTLTHPIPSYMTSR